MKILTNPTFKCKRLVNSMALSVKNNVQFAISKECVLSRGSYDDSPDHADLEDEARVTTGHGCDHIAREHMEAE